MKYSTDYSSDHLIAKVAVYILYVVVGVASVEVGAPYVALIVGTAIWLFGINSVAYCVETIRGHEHNHKLL